MYVDVRRTYKFRMYRNDKRDGYLHQQINVAGLVWNHALALQRRYYRLTGQYIGPGRLKKHIAKLRMKTQRYGFWKDLGSQAVQDVLERLDKAYQRFFAGQGGLPRFKKVKKYRSFTLKQAGWKLLDSGDKRYGKIQLGKRQYKFVQHRQMNGVIKTVTIKRDSAGRLWLCFSVLEKLWIPEEVSAGEISGFDFGLQTFLTDHTGHQYLSPEFFRQELKRVRTLNRSVSRKVKGSKNRQQAGWMLARTHIRVDDKRRDFHFQLAHDLCDQYDVLVFETLNMDAMKRLWGRKVSDLGFAQFVSIVEWVAFKRGKQVLFLDRWTPTTQTCSNCGARQKLELKERTFACGHCGLTLDRDHNAAINIRAGASAHTARGDIRLSLDSIAVDGRSPRL
jgi:putative transposase